MVPHHSCVLTCTGRAGTPGEAPVLLHYPRSVLSGKPACAAEHHFGGEPTRRNKSDSENGIILFATSVTDQESSIEEGI